MQKGVLKKLKSWLESLGLDCLPWSSYPVFCRILNLYRTFAKN